MSPTLGVSDIWATADEKRFLREPKSQPMRLTNGPLSYSSPLPSRDGRRVFVVGSKLRGELVRFDDKVRQFVPYLGGISATAVNFSRDGEWVSYLSYPDHSLWRMRKDGSEKLRLISSGLVAGSAQWSPDTHKIAFSGVNWGKKEVNGVYTIFADGGTLEKVIEYGATGPSWSPDGHSLVYDQFQSVTKYDIRIIDLRTKNTTVIPGSEGKWGPLWSPDGRFLLATTANLGGDLLIFHFRSQTWSVLAKGSFLAYQWSPDSKYVYAVDSNPNNPHAVRVRVTDKHVETITSLESVHRIQDEYVGDWACPAPDGSILTTRDIGTQEIYALEVKWP